MSLAIDLWLLSALLVLAAITLAVVLDAGAGWMDRDTRAPGSAGEARPAGVHSPAPGKKKNLERFVYRHHRSFGAFVLIGAGVYLTLIAAKGLLWPSDAAGILGVLLPTLTLLHLALLPFGAVMLLRPSLLKRLEAASNRWIEWQGKGLERCVRTLVGLYCLAALVVLIAERVRGL